MPLPALAAPSQVGWIQGALRAYRAAAREEPTPELDDAIRAAARRGAGWGTRALGRPAVRTWGVPLAIAATVVVGVSVAFLGRVTPILSSSNLTTFAVLRYSSIAASLPIQLRALTASCAWATVR